MNSVSSLNQESLSVDIRLKNKIMKKVKRISKNLFKSNKTLNVDFDSR